MTVKPGSNLPEARLMMMGEEGPKAILSSALLGRGRVVLFAVPGAFTPTCSAKHLPGFIDQADRILDRGVDRIVCMAVNDIFVMDAWARASGADQRITMAADGNGEFTRALGLEMDGSAFGMGARSQRFAMIIRDGLIEQLMVEQPGQFRVSSAEHVVNLL